MIDFRRRTGALLLAVVIGHVVVISVQVNTRSGVSVFEGVTFGLFSEVQRGVAWGVGGVGMGGEHEWGPASRPSRRPSKGAQGRAPARWLLRSVESRRDAGAVG